MPESTKDNEKLERRIAELESELERLNSRLRSFAGEYDSFMRSSDFYRSVAGLHEVVVDENWLVVDRPQKTVIEDPKFPHVRAGRHLKDLLYPGDFDKIIEHDNKVRALATLDYDDGEPWELVYHGPREEDRIGSQWIPYSYYGINQWEISRGKIVHRHDPEVGEGDFYLVSAREYGGPEEDVRIEYRVRLPEDGTRICDVSLFMAGALEIKGMLPDRGGYTFGTASRMNTTARIQRKGADMSVIHESLEPGGEYLITCERTGGRLSREIENTATGWKGRRLEYIDSNAAYAFRNHVGFTTFAADMEISGIRIYARPSRFSVKDFQLDFCEEVRLNLDSYSDRVFLLRMGEACRDEGIDRLLLFEDITSAKLVEERLTASEERLRTIFRTTPDCIAVVRMKDGLIDQVNEGFMEMTGYAQDEVLGRTTLMMGIWSSREDRERFIAELKKNGSVDNYEMTYRRRDGENRAALMSARRIDFAAQDFMVVVARDIEKWKQAERESRESLELLRAFGSAFPDLAFIIDEQGRYVKVLGGEKALLIRDADVLEGRLLSEILPGDVADGALKKIRESIETGETGVLHYELDVPAGKRWFEGRCSPLKLPLEGRRAVVWISRDVTERKAAEEAIVESEHKYRRIFENARDVYFETTLDGKILVMSPSVQALLGYTNDELVNTSALVGYNDPEDREKLIDELKAHGSVNDFEIDMRNKNGEVRNCSLSCRLYTDPNTGERRLTGSFRDITERKEQEEQRRQLERRLARAQKMESLGLLAGGVAHDLNNILSGLVSYPEMLLMQPGLDSSMKKYIETIRDSGKRAADVVHDLLSMARRDLSDPVVLDLNELVEETLSSLEIKELLAGRPNIHLKKDPGKDLLSIRGSRSHLVKMLMNLVRNAAEAMPRGGEISIATSSRYVDTPLGGYDNVVEGDYAVLTVADQGTGISGQDLPRIFEPFYTKKIMGRSGSGLGLSVVWATIKDHRGYIDVRSDEDSGTEMGVYLPATREQPEHRKEEVSIQELEGRGEKILVVDDVPEQRVIALGILERLGYEVAAVESGEAAVEYLKNNSADLLLLDMIMEPGIDGLETYRRVLELHPGQKAVIASGFAETGRVQQARRMGAGRYLRKPYTLRDLAEKIKAELHGD